MQQRLEALTYSQLRLRHTLKKAFKRSNVHSCHKPALEQKVWPTSLRLKSDFADLTIAVVQLVQHLCTGNHCRS